MLFECLYGFVVQYLDCVKSGSAKVIRRVSRGRLFELPCVDVTWVGCIDVRKIRSPGVAWCEGRGVVRDWVDVDGPIPGSRVRLERLVVDSAARCT